MRRSVSSRSGEMELERVKITKTTEKTNVTRTKIQRSATITISRSKAMREKQENNRFGFVRQHQLHHQEQHMVVKQHSKVAQKGVVAADVDKLKKSLQLAMKERLWLERQLAFLTQNLQQNGEVCTVSKYVQLTKTNQTLVHQVEYLNNLIQQNQYVEKELKDRERECKLLEFQLIEKAQFCDHIVAELEKAVEKNFELSVLSSDAQQQLQRLQHQMRDVADRRKQLEREHKDVLGQLQQRQEEIQKLHWSKDAERQKNAESIESLESKLRELEKKCELQNVRHEEIMLEMDSMKRTQIKKEAQRFSKDIDSLSNGYEKLDNSNIMSSDIGSHSSYTVSGKTERSHESNVPTRNTPTPKNVPSDTVSEIDRIMAKLEQDNKILAELDRTRASIASRPVTSGRVGNAGSLGSTSSSTGTTTTTGLGTSMSSRKMVQPETGFISMMSSYQSSSSQTTNVVTTTVTTASTTVSTTNTTTTTTMTLGGATIGSSINVPHQSHNPLSSLTEQLNSVLAGSNLLPTIITTSADHDARSGVPLDGPRHMLNNEDPNSFLDIPGVGKVYVHIARYTYDPLHHSPNENPEAELPVNAGDYVLVRGDMDEDGFFDGQLLDGRRGLVPSNFVERLTGEDLLDFQQNFLYGMAGNDDGMGSYPMDFSLDNSLEDSQMLIENCLPGDVLCLSNLDNIDEADDILCENNGDGPEIFFSALVPTPQNLVLERQFHKSILISWTAPPGAASSLESFNVYVDGELRTTVLANERPRALVEGVESIRPHRISVRSVTPNRRMSVDAACTMIIGKGVPVAPSCVRASNITSTSAIISWLPSNSNFQHVVCVNSVEVRMLKPSVYRHTITGLSPNTTYRVTVKVKNIKSQQTDDKGTGRLETSSTSVDFRTLPKGLPDPPLDVQVEPGPQDGTLLVTWLPVTINATGTSNGSQVTGYAIYADGKKVVDIDSPTGDHALLELGKFITMTPKHVTVRTKSGDSVSPDSVQVPIPSLASKQARAKLKKKVPEEEYQEESSDRSELSDIAEEAEEDVSDVQQARSAGKDWKKVEASKSDRKKDPSKSRKEHDSKTATSKSSTSRSHDDRRSRHQDGNQTVIEPDENLSDKEIYPSTHISIPAIEITRDSASEGRRHSVDFSDEDYGGSHHRRDVRGQVGGSGGVGGGPRDGSGGRDRGRPVGRDVSAAAGPYAGGGGSGSGDRAGRRTTRDGTVPQQQPHRADHHPHHAPPPRGVRNFVALFDYDPKTMSPNPGAAMEELPFREGQLIKIYGDKDPDGFYWGEVAGRQGYVPCNMVSQVQGEEEAPQSRRAVPVPRRADQPHRGYGGSGGGGRNASRERWGDTYEGLAVKKMVALYDYDPQELSPNVDAEVELSFNTGDVIYVYGDMDEDGFFMGEMNGVRGLVPSNFLTEAPVDYPEDQPQRRHGGGGGGGSGGMDHVGGPSSKNYDGHGMARRPAHPDSNKYNHTRSGGQRW